MQPYIIQPSLSVPDIQYGQLCQLLLDKEGPQVGKLPRAGYAQNYHLNQGPSHNSRVCGLRLVSELSFSLLNVYLVNALEQFPPLL